MCKWKEGLKIEDGMINILCVHTYYLFLCHFLYIYKIFFYLCCDHIFFKQFFYVFVGFFSYWPWKFRDKCSIVLPLYLLVLQNVVNKNIFMSKRMKWARNICCFCLPATSTFTVTTETYFVTASVFFTCMVRWAVSFRWHS